MTCSMHFHSCMGHVRCSCLSYTVVRLQRLEDHKSSYGLCLAQLLMASKKVNAEVNLEQPLSASSGIFLVSGQQDVVA